MRQISLSNLLQRAKALINRPYQGLTSIFAHHPTPIHFNPKTNTFRFRRSKLELPPDTYQSEVMRIIWSEPNKVWNNDELIALLFDQIAYNDTAIYCKKIYDAIRAVNLKAQQQLQTEVVISQGRAWQANTLFPNTLF